MDTEALKNGTAMSTPPAPAPANPEVIRQAQSLLDAVQRGQVVGFASVGITFDGNVMHVHAVPTNPSMLQLVMGGLNVVIADLISAIQGMRHQQNVSRILKPPMMRHG